jgi:hypothetical protein
MQARNCGDAGVNFSLISKTFSAAQGFLFIGADAGYPLAYDSGGPLVVLSASTQLHRRNLSALASRGTVSDRAI